ncbi:MAG: pilus assembly protein TadG-related protein, partial [Planctomycetes bacterium]|nr:pilus assembly protein TadG-related protein [Planctomycetota bacterium]
MSATKTKQQGASMIIWAISVLPLLGVAALALDVNNLFVASGELQTAADAAALEGATHLYTWDDDAEKLVIRASDVNDNAKTAAKANYARGHSFEDGEIQVQIGHWKFDPAGGGIFTDASVTGQIDAPAVGGKPVYDPDDPESCNNLNNACSGEINAVRVVTERRLTPVQAFFGHLFLDNVRSQGGYFASADAVAYVGFAGSYSAQDVDIPIALCMESILDEDGNSLNCSTGLFISAKETARWTDFYQGEPGDEGCQGWGSADNAVLTQTLCGGLTPQVVDFSKPMSTTTGEKQPVFRDLVGCWKDPDRCNVIDPSSESAEVCDYTNPQLDALPEPTTPWSAVLPVVQCSYQNEACKPVVGVVRVDVLWIVDEANDIDADAPQEMTYGDVSWPDPGDVFEDGEARWNDFADTFNLVNEVYDEEGTVTRVPYEYSQKTIYFSPDCSYFPA